MQEHLRARSSSFGSVMSISVGLIQSMLVLGMVAYGVLSGVVWCGGSVLRNMTLAIFYHAPRSPVDQVVQQAATVYYTDRKPRSIAGYPISIIRTRVYIPKISIYRDIDIDF